MPELSRSELLSGFNDEVNSSILKSIEEKQKGHKARVITKYWPTEASATTPNGIVGKCRRQVYYSQQGLPTAPYDVATIGRFQIGYIFETWIRDTLNNNSDKITVIDNNKKISYPIPCNDKILVSGEVDLIYEIEGEKVGGEIKSSYGYTFNNFVFHKKTIPGMPKIEHTLQVLLYLYYYKFVEPDYGLSRFIISYFDRGSVQIVHHTIEIDDNLIPIVNGITLTGIHDYTNPIFDLKSINTSKTRDKLLDFQLNLGTVFRRFCELYDYHDSGLMVPKDYDPLYSQDVISAKRASGKIAKSKYIDYQSGKLRYLSDIQCTWCGYREKCLKDEGII